MNWGTCDFGGCQEEVTTEFVLENKVPNEKPEGILFQKIKLRQRCCHRHADKLRSLVRHQVIRLQNIYAQMGIHLGPVEVLQIDLNKDPFKGGATVVFPSQPKS